MVPVEEYQISNEATSDGASVPLMHLVSVIVKYRKKQFVKLFFIKTLSKLLQQFY